MKNNYLLPSYFKKIGWISSLIFGVLAVFALFDKLPYWGCKQLAFVDSFKNNEFFKIVDANLLMTITLVGFVASLLFIVLSKEKIEDEYVSRIREKSLVWSLIVNYLIFCIAVIFLFDFMFLSFVFINIYSLLIIFICKFNYELYKFKNSVKDEK